MKYEFRSTIPCLVKYQGGEEFLEDGQSLVFEKPLKMFVYPAQKGYASFVLDCNANVCPIKRFALPDRILYYFSENTKPKICVKEKTSIGATDVTFIIGQNELQVECNNIIKSIPSISPKTYELTNHDKLALLKVKGEKSEQLTIVNTLTNQITNLVYDRIEINDDEIFCEKFEKEEKYQISDDGIIKVRSIPSQIRNTKILGMSFLEMVKAKQYKDACTLLSDRLASSEEKIAAYFGDIDEILPLSENTYLLDKKTGPLIVKIDLNKDKIVNIEMVD